MNSERFFNSSKSLNHKVSGNGVHHRLTLVLSNLVTCRMSRRPIETSTERSYISSIIEFINHCKYDYSEGIIGIYRKCTTNKLHLTVS